MLRTISLTAYNRPDYLRQTLESIRRADPGGYTLVICVEPGCDEVWALCEGVDWAEKILVKNDRRLGQRLNTFKAVETAFAAGSGLNVYLEDDIVISPDALRLVEWCADYPFGRVGRPACERIQPLRVWTLLWDVVPTLSKRVVR